MEKINKDIVILKKPISFFSEDKKNIKIHGEKSMLALNVSLKTFGQIKPIVCLSSGKIIAGNGIYLAAKNLGWKTLAAIIFPDEEKAAAYALADNRTSDLSEYDDLNLDAVLKNTDKEFMAILDLEVPKIDESEIKTENIKPYKKIHILVSFDIVHIKKAQELLSELAKKYTEAQVDTGEN